LKIIIEIKKTEAFLSLFWYLLKLQSNQIP
jgi:hypothetical protein